MKEKEDCSKNVARVPGRGHVAYRWHHIFRSTQTCKPLTAVFEVNDELDTATVELVIYIAPP